jgi:hypothetical protein
MSLATSAITKIWGGVCVPFPHVRDRGEDTYIWIRDGKIRNVLATYKVDYKHDKLTDLVIKREQLMDLFILENLLLPNVIIVVDFDDCYMFAQVGSIYLRATKHSGKKAADLYDEHGDAFIPLELFGLITNKGTIK